ncbi:MAG: hypothetical protein V4689_12455 [Verrucomicrobiota bacterium]
MLETHGEFTKWACSPDRTLEERFGVQLLIEATHNLWRRLHDIPIDFNFDYDCQRNKARSLDPAYRPKYDSADTHHVVEILPELKDLSLGHSDDRPLRDVSFLRFCTRLESLQLHQSEIPDFSPLAALTSLTSLHLRDGKCRDFRVIGQLTRLESLHLRTQFAWPDLSGLERLVNLTDFHFSGNLLALQPIPELPALRVATIENGVASNLPLRSVADFPAMPELRRLKLGKTCELHGIERFPKLLNLQIQGDFTDLTPLSQLHDLTHLILSGGEYPGLAPVSHLPELRKITLAIEFPPDLTPLADLPRLHEIVLKDTPVVPAELAPLNSMCIPWSEEFELKPARPLQPYRLLLRTPELREHEDTTALPRDYGDDEEMSRSEAIWFIRRLNRRMDRLLGKGWGVLAEPTYGGAGGLHINITRPADIDHLPAVLKLFRKLIATSRHPWSCLLVIDTLGEYGRDLEEIQHDPDTYDAERERIEWEDYFRRKREHKEFLQRKYLHQLNQESGLDTPPATPPPVFTELPDGNLAEKDFPDDDDDTYQDAQSEFIESEIPDNEYDLGTKLELYATLTEKGVYVNERDIALAEMLFEMKLES